MQIRQNYNNLYLKNFQEIWKFYNFFADFMTKSKRDISNKKILHFKTCPEKADYICCWMRVQNNAFLPLVQYVHFANDAW